MNLISFENMMNQKESIEVSLSLLDSFPGHPFRVQENEDMKELIESIRENGVLVPVILRRHGDGRYQIIAGHRRCFASRYLKKETIPAVIKDITEAEATVWMVDSNIQRTDILPSEKAKAYQMKIEALAKQGKRTDLTLDDDTSRQLVGRWKKETAEQIGAGESGRQVQRYLRLNHLIPELLERVDQKALSFLAGVELSYLTEGQQKIVSAYLEQHPGGISLNRAKKLKEQGKQEPFSESTVGDILGGKQPEKKKACGWEKDEYETYFPEGYTKQERSRIIRMLLEKWRKGEIEL